MTSLRTFVLAAAAAAVATAAHAQVTPTPAPPSAPPPAPQAGETQPAPPPAPEAPSGQRRDFRGGGGDFRGHVGGMRHFGPGGPGPMPASKGAFLRFDKQGGVTLKCPDEESTKACLEAAQPLVEKMLQAR